MRINFALFISFISIYIFAMPVPADALEDELPATIQMESHNNVGVHELLSGYLMAFDYLDITRPLDEAGLLDGEDSSGMPWLRHDRAGMRLQLRLAGEASENVSFDTSLNLEYDGIQATRDPRAELSDGMEYYFKEGFISIRRALNIFDLKIGRQYIFWGLFEWGGALDIISPWDYSHMSAEKENFRLAVDALRLWVNLDPVVLETFAIPVFTPNRIPLDLPDKMGPMDVRELQADMPETSIENTEIGAKLSFPTFFGGETSLYYFHGFDRTFSLYVDITAYKLIRQTPTEISMPTELTFTPRYEPLQVAGFDTEYLIGPLSLLIEGAYFYTNDDDGTDIYITNRNTKGAIGFECDLTSRLSLSSVISHTHLFNYDHDAEYQARIALQPEDTVSVDREEQTQGVYRLRYMPTSDLSLQLMQMLDFYDWDLMTLAFAGWEIVSGVKLYAGVVAFRGHYGTTFGRLQEESRLFFELKYSF